MKVPEIGGLTEAEIAEVPRDTGLGLREFRDLGFRASCLGFEGF